MACCLGLCARKETARYHLSKEVEAVFDPQRSDGAQTDSGEQNDTLHQRLQHVVGEALRFVDAKSRAG